MNTLKKMLVTATMVVTLGATTSCGNKDSKPNFVGGLPYTLFTVSRLYTGDTYTIRFECDGNPEVYWNSETPNHEKSHVFTYNPDQPGSEPIVLIKGDIDNLRFCDGNGNLLEEDNAHILTVVFSNKIKKTSRIRMLFFVVITE